MIIEADFNAVPDVVKPIGSGIYDMLVTSVSTQPPKKSTTLGTTIVLKLQIQNDGPYKGRQITDYLFVSADPKQTKEERERGLTNIKRAALSAGITPGLNGLNVAELQGRTVKAAVSNGTMKDESTGVIKETSNVSKYFIPGDAEMSQPQPVGA